MITSGPVREILDKDFVYKMPANALQVEGDVHLRGDLRYPDGYWVDIDFPIIIRTTGANRPVLETLTGNITVPQWAVDDFAVIEGQEIIHGYKEGSPIQWHVHMITNGTDATDRFVKWEIEWTWVNAFGVLATAITTTSDELLIPADTPDRTMLVREIAVVSLPALEIGSHIFARLKRVASTGTAPAQNPFLTMLQLHVLCDSIGSVNMTNKPSI